MKIKSKSKQTKTSNKEYYLLKKLASLSKKVKKNKKSVK